VDSRPQHAYYSGLGVVNLLPFHNLELNVGLKLLRRQNFEGWFYFPRFIYPWRAGAFHPSLLLASCFRIRPGTHASVKNVAPEQLLGTAESINMMDLVAHVYRMALGIDRMLMDWSTWEGKIIIFVSRESMLVSSTFPRLETRSEDRRVFYGLPLELCWWDI
jgi:hypothetical protein